MSYNSVEDYVKNAESNRNPAVLNSLLESEPGMKELPEITPEDEGKVLQVSDGSPSWSSGGSSGGGALKVNVTETQSESETRYTLDKTWKQISDAIENGTISYVIDDDEGDKDVNILSRVYTFEDDGATFYVVKFGQYAEYIADSENGYPYTSGGGGSQ